MPRSNDNIPDVLCRTRYGYPSRILNLPITAKPSQCTIITYMMILTYRILVSCSGYRKSVPYGSLATSQTCGGQQSCRLDSQTHSRPSKTPEPLPSANSAHYLLLLAFFTVPTRSLRSCNGFNRAGVRFSAADCLRRAPRAWERVPPGRPLPLCPPQFRWPPPLQRLRARAYLSGEKEWSLGPLVVLVEGAESQVSARELFCFLFSTIPPPPLQYLEYAITFSS